MRKTIMLSTAVLCALGAITLSSDVSLAGAPACGGHTPVFGDGGCFSLPEGCAVQNTCGTTKIWRVSGFITTGGNHTALVTVFQPSGGSALCQACPTNKEGFTVGCTDFKAPAVSNVDTQLNLGIVNVPSFGGIYVSCKLSPGAWYDSVNW